MNSNEMGQRLRRRGFTLVELLVVMTIIGILMGLITVAVIAARNRARIAQVGVEIQGLSNAINEYQNKFGDLPPDFAGVWSTPAPQAPNNARVLARAAVVQHISRAFPRLVLSGRTTDQQWNSLRNLILDQRTAYGQSNIALRIDYLDPSTALTFWLGGMPELDDRNQFTGRLIGFSANPLNPFENNRYSPSRIPPLFEFDPSRLTKTRYNWYRYQPGYGGGGSTPPYIYFRSPYYLPNGNTPWILEWRRINANAGGETEEMGTVQRRQTAQPAVRPYYNETQSGARFTVEKFFNPRTFQIICAGADSNYGGVQAGYSLSTPPRFPLSDNLFGGYLDNQTNFVPGVLEDLQK